MEIWLVIAILCSFLWAVIRTASRPVTFLNFLRFIAEFIGMPVIVVYNEFKK